MQIAGLQKFTMVDFPGKVAATVFTRGCSFRCPYCHNPELVIPERFNPLLDESEVLDFFAKRIGKLQGVCITGGEPTLQTDLLEFIGKLKSLGYKIKLDTNGWNPNILKSIINSGNIDYIAMDIKAAPRKYPIAIGNIQCSTSNQYSIDHLENERLNGNCTLKNENLLSSIKKSINLIMDSSTDYEFRTTVCHPIHEVEDFKEIGKMIKGAKRYFIQNFVQSKHNDEKTKFEPFTEGELEKSKTVMKHFIEEVSIR